AIGGDAPPTLGDVGSWPRPLVGVHIGGELVPLLVGRPGWLSPATSGAWPQTSGQGCPAAAPPASLPGRGSARHKRHRVRPPVRERGRWPRSRGPAATRAGRGSPPE